MSLNRRLDLLFEGCRLPSSNKKNQTIALLHKVADTRCCAQAAKMPRSGCNGDAMARVFEKLNFKGQPQILLINAPASFAGEVVLWFAYPKGSSKTLSLRL